MVELADLFEVNRFPKGIRLLPVLFYAPLGILLFISRLFIGIQALVAASILAENSAIRSFILRVMCTVLGIVVKSKKEENRKEDVKLLVTNHVTCLDHLAIHLLNNCITPCVWDFPPTLIWALGYRDLGVKQGRSVLTENVKKHFASSSVPLLGHPEGATTSGKIALLQFSSWLFNLEHPVQPIAIKVERPRFCDITPGVLGSRWWSDLFWFLFVPWTVFDITYLPVMTKGDKDTPEDFSKEVSKAIAKSLGIEVTAFTCSDKVEYLKRISHPTVTSSFGHGSTKMQSQINKVKEILPHVPWQVIAKDLMKTRNVDATIFRILEGVVPFVPEMPETTQPVVKESNDGNQMQESDSNLESPLTYNLDTSAKQFPSSAKDRMLSFAVRKQKLYENARRRYILKHDLKVPGINC